jgi:hypothetical protein
MTAASRRFGIVLLCAAALPSAAIAAPQLRVADNRVQVLSGEEVVAESPREGLWSIACDWRDGWPTGWVHGSPARISTEEAWTIAVGEIAACGGVWAISDAYRVEGATLRGIRRFEWKGKAAAPKTTLSVRFESRSDSAQYLLPGILYYGNPSGAASGRVPVFNAAPGEAAIYEEHRYPMPFALAELRRGTRLWGAALHSLPSPAPHANLPDQWWSLGVIRREGASEFTLLTGPCASNEQRSVIKALQRGFVPYNNAYLNVPPGAIIEKTFYLEVFPVTEEGSAFQQPAKTSLHLFRPFFGDDMPAFSDIVRAKYRYAKTRWRETADYAVFQKYVDRKQAVMGWTGQAEAPGYAFQVLAARLQDPSAEDMARKSLDFIARSATFYEGGFYNWFDLDKKQWERQEILNQGQAMLSFARAIEVGRKNQRDTRLWEQFLRKAAEIHARRILAAGWRPVSTNEASFVAPLLKTAALFRVDDFRKAAVKAAEHYAARHLSMREPYWGGTLDARSEDKEGAAIAFQAFLELYETTRNPLHLKWARHACDVMLTYTFTWDVPFPPGRLSDHRLRTRGWTSVSPQNQHLDVWGVFTAPDVYRLGQIDNREDLKALAIVMYRSCGQLIDAHGSQGEQMQHTNYTQGSTVADLARLRGGYNETWTVFWITAHFLSGAARFMELGVPVL